MKKKQTIHGHKWPWTKLLLVMRLSIFLMLAFVFAAQAKSFSQSGNLTLNMSRVKLVDVLNEIEKQTDYYFYYNLNLDEYQISQLSVKNRDVKDVLDKMLTDLGLVYETVDRYVVIKKSDDINQANIANHLVQQKGISGRVTDKTGQPLPGVTVVVKGTSTGIITDHNGNYSLNNVPNNGVLLFSFVGMKSQEKAIGTNTTINIVMEEESIGIDEVVAIGYGTQKKETLSGAIASLKSDQILTTKSTSVVSSIQGKIPGVQIRQRSGEPGLFNSMVSIRGFGAPLVVIDGVARDGMSMFERLNPEDIESISILKDASAAIYGMNADNGVIIVTTKKGEKGKVKVNYSAFYGIKMPTAMEETVDAYTYRILRNEMDKNTGNPASFSPEVLEKFRIGTEPGYQDFNWIDITLKDRTNQQQHNLSLSGGNEKLKFYTSLGYSEDNGLLTSNIQKYRKYNFRNSVTAEIADGFTAKVTVAGKYDENKGPQMGYIWAFKPIMTQDRGYGPFAVGYTDRLTRVPPEGKNAYAFINEDINGYDKWNDFQYQSTIDLVYKLPFLKGLQIGVLAAYDGSINNSSNLNKSYYLHDYYTGEPYPAKLTTYQNSNNIFTRKNVQFQVTYKNTFNEAHNVGATFVNEIRSTTTNYLTAKRQYDDVYTHDIINQGSLTDATNGGYRNKTAFLSYLGRFNYDYKMKYLLEAAFRYDGSYRYAPSSRWAFFPSFSAGWRISEENFIKNNLPVISNLKLRASYGKMGADAGDPFEYYAGYQFGGIGGGYVFNEAVLTMGMVPPKVVNDNLTWVKTQTANIGLDLDVWNGKLGYSMDVFQKNRNGLLASRIQSVPNTFGASFPQENINSDLVRGIEFELSHKNKIREFTYGVSGNLTFSRVYLVHRERQPYASTMQKWTDVWGSNRYLGREWGYEYDGVYTDITQYETAPLMGGNSGNSKMLPGSTKITDVNGDGVINASDMLPIFWRGQYQGAATNPPLHFGANLNASWKSFDVNVLLQGSALFTVFMHPFDLWGFGKYPTLLTKYLDRWHPENSDADPFDPATKWVPGENPALITVNSGPDRLITDKWRVDAKYLRVKSVELGYNLPKNLAQKISADNVRVYLNGFNLFTLADKRLKTMDPEREEGDYQADMTYPLMRSYNLGVNVNF